MKLSFSVLLVIFCLTLLSFSCNKNQANTTTNSNSNLPSGQQPSQTFIQTSPNVTSATIKQGESGTGLEKYANKEAKEAVAFNVSTDRLESIINDTKLQVSFGIPKEYQSRNYTTIPQNDIARKFTDFTTKEFTGTPLYAFSNGINSMVVSQIQTNNPMNLQEFITSYEALNKSRFVPATVLLASFKNKDIPMTQFTIQESESGLIRIIMPSAIKNRFIQFDYTIRRTSFQADMERIEPSVGSIMRIAANAP